MYNGTSANVELKPPALMDELASAGVKYTEEDVLMVTKNADGFVTSFYPLKKKRR